MKCIRCGNEIKDTDKFCMCCGQKVEDKIKDVEPTPVEKKEPIIEDKHVTNNETMSFEDEELLKTFVGNNYDKLSKPKFNFPAFFLGPIYLIYRKVYLIAFIMLIITFFFSGMSLMLNVVLAILFNEYYIKYAKKKIEDIKRLNPNTDIHDIVLKKGGTNIVLAIVLIIIYVAIILIIAAIFILAIYTSVKETINNTKENNQSNQIIELPEEEETPSYEYTGEHILDLYYKVPDNYQTINYNEYETGRYTKYEDKTICHFEISTTNMDERGYFNFSKEVSETTINNIRYKLLEKSSVAEEQKIETSYYYTTYNNKNYILTFTKTNDINSFCLNDQKQILDNIYYKVDNNTNA